MGDKNTYEPACQQNRIPCRRKLGRRLSVFDDAAMNR